MANEIKKRSINELHSDTRILYNVLETALIKNEKDFISYGELSKAIARDVREGARGLLKTARKHLERNYKLILEVVVNEGIKKSDAYLGVLEKESSHIRRRCRLASRRVLNAIEDKELDNPGRIQIATKLSQFSAIDLFTSPKAVKQIEEKIKNKDGNELATAETLKLFTDGRND